MLDFSYHRSLIHFLCRSLRTLTFLVSFHFPGQRQTHFSVYVSALWWLSNTEVACDHLICVWGAASAWNERCGGAKVCRRNQEQAMSKKCWVGENEREGLEIRQVVTPRAEYRAPTHRVGAESDACKERFCGPVWPVRHASIRQDKSSNLLSSMSERGSYNRYKNWVQWGKKFVRGRPMFLPETEYFRTGSLLCRILWMRAYSRHTEETKKFHEMYFTYGLLPKLHVFVR